MSRGRGPTWGAASEWRGGFARRRSRGSRTGRTGTEFEVGLLDEDWTASWISPVETDDPGYGRRPAYLLAMEFPLAEHVRSARLYATALGVYTVTINGARVGTAELSPGSTSYDRTLYAQATDVTASLAPGANRIELELSDGWYRGQVGAFRLPAGWGSTLGARAELHLEMQDGTHRVIRTDGTWTSRRSRTTRADLMDGQTVDFAAEPDDEHPVRVDQVDAPPIDWSPAPPVRVIETRAPVALRPVARRRLDRRLRPERLRLDPPHRSRTRGHPDGDRLRRARRTRRGPDHRAPRLREARRGGPGVRAARRGRRRRQGRRGLRATAHGPRLPVRAHRTRRRHARRRRDLHAGRAHRPGPHRHVRVQRRRPEPTA